MISMFSPNSSRFNAHKLRSSPSHSWFPRACDEDIKHLGLLDDEEGSVILSKTGPSSFSMGIRAFRLVFTLLVNLIWRPYHISMEPDLLGRPLPKTRCQAPLDRRGGYSKQVTTRPQGPFLKLQETLTFAGIVLPCRYHPALSFHPYSKLVRKYSACSFGPSYSDV